MQLMLGSKQAEDKAGRIQYTATFALCSIRSSTPGENLCRLGKKRTCLLDLPPVWEISLAMALSKPDMLIGVIAVPLNIDVAAGVGQFDCLHSHDQIQIADDGQAVPSRERISNV